MHVLWGTPKTPLLLAQDSLTKPDCDFSFPRSQMGPLWDPCLWLLSMKLGAQGQGHQVSLLQAWCL